MKEKDVEPVNPAWSWLQCCQSSTGPSNETEQLSSQDMYESNSYHFWIFFNGL